METVDDGPYGNNDIAILNINNENKIIKEFKMWKMWFLFFKEIIRRSLNDKY